MKIGYARVANHEENLAHQLDMLVAEGCEWLYTDNVSGVNPNKPALDEAMASAQPGDMLVIWKLDRLGRSVDEIIARAADLQDRDVGFRSIGDGIDTHAADAAGFYGIMAALGRFQQHGREERGAAGSSAMRGRHAMEPGSEKLSAEQWRAARKLISDKGAN